MHYANDALFCCSKVWLCDSVVFCIVRLPVSLDCLILLSVPMAKS